MRVLYFFYNFRLLSVITKTCAVHKPGGIFWGQIFYLCFGLKNFAKYLKKLENDTLNKIRKDNLDFNLQIEPSYKISALMIQESLENLFVTSFFEIIIAKHFKTR